MTKFIAALMIVIASTSSIADGAARAIERGSAASQVRGRQLEDGDEVSLPQMRLPPINAPLPVEEPEPEEPFDWTEWADPKHRPKPEEDNQPKEDLPDYTIPGVETEQSTTPSTDQIETDEGLEFKVVNRDGIMAFALIAAHENYELRPALARGVIPGRASVKSMSSGATAAINASYFGMSGELYGVTKIDGVIVGSTYYTRSAIGVDINGATMFGRVEYRGVLRLTGTTIGVDGINCSRSADSLIVYNNFQGQTTGTNDYGIEVVVEKGVVKLVTVGKGNNAIPPGGYVISAHGSKREQLKNVRAGDRIAFDEQIIDVDGAGDWSLAVQVIGAGPRLVKDGKVYVNVVQEQFPSDIRVGRAPRSAVGVTKYGDYIFAVVDGRQAHSRGCTLNEWASVLINDFGAVDAINLDGGGSTELIVNGNIVNSPSDGKERPVADALLIVKKK